MAIGDDFRSALRLMEWSKQLKGHSAKSVDIPQDVPNYSAKGLSGASTPGLSSQQSGLSTIAGAASGISSAVKTIGGLFS